MGSVCSKKNIFSITMQFYILKSKCFYAETFTSEIQPSSQVLGIYKCWQPSAGLEFSESAGDWSFTFIKKHIGYKCGDFSSFFFFMMGKAKNISSTVQKKETHGMIWRSEGK